MRGDTEQYRRGQTRAMQDRTLCRIAAHAVERRYGNGPFEKWKKIIHAIGYGASLKSILTGRVK